MGTVQSLRTLCSLIAMRGYGLSPGISSNRLSSALLQEVEDIMCAETWSGTHEDSKYERASEKKIAEEGL